MIQHRAEERFSIQRILHERSLTRYGNAVDDLSLPVIVEPAPTQPLSGQCKILHLVEFPVEIIRRHPHIAGAVRFGGTFAERKTKRGMKTGGKRHDRTAEIGHGKFLKHTVRQECISQDHLHLMRESGKHRIPFIVKMTRPHNGLPLLFRRVKELPRIPQHHAVNVIPEPVVDRKSIIASAP